MSIRTGGASFNAGTLAPKKYEQFTVEYTDLSGGGYIATYRYYGRTGDLDTLMATLEIEYDESGRDIRGNLVEDTP